MMPIQLSDLHVDPEVHRVMNEAAVAGVETFQVNAEQLSEGYYTRGADGGTYRHSWVVIRRLGDDIAVVRYQDQHLSKPPPTTATL